MGVIAKSNIGVQPAVFGNIASNKSESKKMNNCCFSYSVSLICSFLLKQLTVIIANMILKNQVIQFSHNNEQETCDL